MTRRENSAGLCDCKRSNRTYHRLIHVIARAGLVSLAVRDQDTSGGAVLHHSARALPWALKGSGHSPSPKSQPLLDEGVAMTQALVN
jgi:hypothetical protein